MVHFTEGRQDLRASHTAHAGRGTHATNATNTDSGQMDGLFIRHHTRLASTCVHAPPQVHSFTSVKINPLLMPKGEGGCNGEVIVIDSERIYDDDLPVATPSPFAFPPVCCASLSQSTTFCISTS